MGALSINQLLEKAQERGVELDLETSDTENQVLLDAIEKMSYEAMPKVLKRGTELVISLLIFL